MPNKKLHLTNIATLVFCVCRVAPFYTKTLSAIFAGELGVRYMKKINFSTFVLLFSIFLSGCVPTSDNEDFSGLINKRATLLKPMILVDVDDYGFFWINHLIDPSRHFWAKYEVITKLEVGHTIELVDVESFTSEPGKQYLIKGNFQSRGKTFTFHYTLPGSEKPTKKELEKIWTYQ